MTENGNSLFHTRWNCKYHIIFVPEFWRKTISGKLKADIGRTLSECKHVVIEKAGMA